MPGVVFLIVVPTANFERELIYGSNNELLSPVPSHQIITTANTMAAAVTGGDNNNLNINLPENSKNNNDNSSSTATLRLEVELRDKNAPKYRRGFGVRGGITAAAARGRGAKNSNAFTTTAAATSKVNVGNTATVTAVDTRIALVPLEKVLEELLTKLEIEHVTWTTGKKGYFHHVVFPLQSGEPCETTLHCLTELGIGVKLNSSVSVLPCSVSYDALTDAAYKDELSEESKEDLSKWNNFVDSIKSKLTVKQVVDGVRAGGEISFDYLLLIVTADSLAALGLIENNASNIVAAMLVSPLMGPVMSMTFGTIISDWKLVRVGFATLALGMFISCLFGFIFGLILGTTNMPWGSGDWPTEEMRGRGNARSLWMGVLWALTSGTGVAVALLQGSAGPLIGVAISASLLPPVVNCGLFWALACIKLIYPDIRMPHLKGEPYDGNTSYPFIYTNYVPTEFLVNGIVSCLLTVVNVICIFITAIIVLIIKEVSAPYTASPDLKRFWETDLRTARKTNRSTIRHQRKGTLRDKLLPSGYQELDEPRNRELDTVLEQALKEAEDDATFKKVKRMSYSSNAAGELPQRLAQIAGLNKHTGNEPLEQLSLLTNTTHHQLGSHTGSRLSSLRNSKVHADLKALDKLVTALLEQHATNPNVAADALQLKRKSSFKLNRWRPTSRSAHSFNINEHGVGNNGMGERGGGGSSGNNRNNIRSNSFASIQEHLAALNGVGTNVTNTNTMPTIMETSTNAGYPNVTAATNINSATSSLERGNTTTNAMRNMIQTLTNVPQRLSQHFTGHSTNNNSNNNNDNDNNNNNNDNNSSTVDVDEERLNLTQNYLA